MILIGITGKSGAGKTSYAKMLAESLNCEVYSFDNLQYEVQEWKEKVYMKKFTVISADETGENKKYINPKIKGQSIDSDAIEKIYEKIKMLVLKNIIKKHIRQNRANGAKYFIIEGTQLSVFVDQSKLDNKILLKRLYDRREHDIVLRDGITEEQFKAREIYDKDKIEAVKNFDYTIQNNGTMEELRMKAEEVANKIDEKSKNQMTH